MSADWNRARAVADAVLYEGYLLYPYRATSQKNQSRWQFGVLGPPGAEAAGIGEDDRLCAQLLVQPGESATLTVEYMKIRMVESADSHISAERVSWPSPGGVCLLTCVTPAPVLDMVPPLSARWTFFSV